MNRRFTQRAFCGLIVAAWLFSSAALSQPATDVVGTYCLVGLRELGSCIRLSSGGKFEYFLAYGAFEEKSEGSWKFVNGEVIVDSLPYDRRPTFNFTRMQKSDNDAFDVIVESKAGRPIAGIEVSVTCDGTVKDAGVTQESRYKVDCKSAPTAVALGLSMFGLAPQTIDVAGRAGIEKVYVFAFDPGDLGRRRFVAQNLQVRADGSLVTAFDESPIPELRGRPLRYVRER